MNKISSSFISDIWVWQLMKQTQSLFPRWLTTHIDLLKDQLDLLPDLQLAKQLASLPGIETKKRCVTDNIIASKFHSGSPYPNFWSVQSTSCRKHGKLMVWPVCGMSAAVFPDSSLLNWFASAALHPRGNKSSQSAETGFWGFAFMGGKMIQRLVVFPVIAWVLYGFRSATAARWSRAFVLLHLSEHFPFTLTKAQFYGSLNFCRGVLFFMSIL